MNFSHREETRGDRLLDILTDDDAGIRLIVSRLGAELISLSRNNTGAATLLSPSESGAAGRQECRPSGSGWIGFLYRDNDLSAPASGWANHATVMGYYLHRLKEGRSLYRGKVIEGGTHSFLRQKQWHFSEPGENSGKLRYTITRADYTETEYPLNVSIMLTYELVGEEVRVSFRFRNHESTTAQLEFGLHPGFGASSFQSFQLKMPAGLYRRHLAPDNYLSGETEEIRFNGGEMPFERAKLPGSYILELVDVPDRTFIYHDSPTGRSVTFDFAGVPYVTLWSDGGPFLCIEPCWGLTDHHEQRAFEDKEGIQTIAPHGEIDASFTMSPRLSP